MGLITYLESLYNSTVYKQLKVPISEIWVSPYRPVFIWKYYPENFAFLTIGILELYTRKVCKMFVYEHTETIEYVKN